MSPRAAAQPPSHVLRQVVRRRAKLWSGSKDHHIVLIEIVPEPQAVLCASKGASLSLGCPGRHCGGGCPVTGAGTEVESLVEFHLVFQASHRHAAGFHEGRADVHHVHALPVGRGCHRGFVRAGEGGGERPLRSKPVQRLADARGRLALLAGSLLVCLLRLPGACQKLFSVGDAHGPREMHDSNALVRVPLRHVQKGVLATKAAGDLPEVLGDPLHRLAPVPGHLLDVRDRGSFKVHVVLGEALRHREHAPRVLLAGSRAAAAGSIAPRLCLGRHCRGARAPVSRGRVRLCGGRLRLRGCGGLRRLGRRGGSRCRRLL
mmetsp:Transcript_7848/g.18811  ORF Transcript_7848/g.18811 Transcript_7848/m.18811 type:complete len:318 (+) Transcript_7848:358-1311(+)